MICCLQGLGTPRSGDLVSGWVGGLVRVGLGQRIWLGLTAPPSSLPLTLYSRGF